MELGAINPKILQKLSDPNFQKMLGELLGDISENDPENFAPFYRNKTGKITAGHPGIEKFKKDMELEPIFENEAVKLGLMTETEAASFSGKDIDEDETIDLINVSEEELDRLREKAKELNVPNVHLMKAPRLRAEIKKAENRLNSTEE